MGSLTTHNNRKDIDGSTLRMAGFPYHALDTYLPKLIRAGEHVAICDQLEERKLKEKKRINELVTTPEKPEMTEETSLFDML